MLGFYTRFYSCAFCCSGLHFIENASPRDLRTCWCTTSIVEVDDDKLDVMVHNDTLFILPDTTFGLLAYIFTLSVCVFVGLKG